MMIRSQQRGPLTFVFLVCFSSLSYFGTQIGWFRAAIITPIPQIPYYFSFHLSINRSGLVWGSFVGGFGWLEPPTDSLSFVGTSWPFQWASRSSPAVDVWWASGLGIYSSSSFFRLPYFWGRLFKTLLFEELLPHPNCLATSIRPLNGLLG